MRNTRRTSPTVATTLAAAARDMRGAIRAVDPAQAADLAQLRDTGWQLTQLTGELTDLIALLVDRRTHRPPHHAPRASASGHRRTGHRTPRPRLPEPGHPAAHPRHRPQRGPRLLHRQANPMPPPGPCPSP